MTLHNIFSSLSSNFVVQCIKRSEKEWLRVIKIAYESINLYYLLLYCIVYWKHKRTNIMHYCVVLCTEMTNKPILFLIGFYCVLKWQTLLSQLLSIIFKYLQSLVVWKSALELSDDLRMSSHLVSVLLIRLFLSLQLGLPFLDQKLTTRTFAGQRCYFCLQIKPSVSKQQKKVNSSASVF